MGTSLPAVVDLRWEPGGDLILSWTEAPGARNKTIPAAEIARLQQLADAVGLAEERKQTAAIVEARTALSAALYAWLDGPERALAQRIDAAEAQRGRLVLVVRAHASDRRSLRQHPATCMRWELLPFAETRRRGAPPLAVVLQLGPGALAAPRVLDRSGLRVLFMASSPHDAPPELDFEREEEELLTALAPLAEKRRARLRVVEEGTLDALRRMLLNERFDVVHLSGHGLLTADGPRLVLENDFGAKRLVSPAELIEVLEGAKQMPALVMLSNCHSAEVRGSVASFAAELVAAGVPNVLGWTRPVRDDHATLAASSVYEQLAAGKTPVEAAQLARERMRRSDERAPAPTHAWGTLHLVTGEATGFHVGDEAAPLSERVDRDEVYKYLGGRMRVLQSGFVGRRRLVQRLLRILLHGRDVSPSVARDVAGACVFGMKGVGKSCAVGRVIERATQHAPELRVVVAHGVIDERGVLEAFQEAIATSGGDETAERLLARPDEPVFRRVRRVMEHWRRRPAAIVLDDFEQNLERSTGGPWRVTSEAAALLEALMPACTTGKPKLLVTSIEREHRETGRRGGKDMIFSRLPASAPPSDSPFSRRRDFGHAAHGCAEGTGRVDPAMLAWHLSQPTIGPHARCRRGILPPVRHPFDQLAKRIGREALGPCGLTVVQEEISPDAQYADLRHEPDPEREAERTRLGLLGRIAAVFCLLEIYGHAPEPREFRACLGKHIAFWDQRERKAKKKAQQTDPFVEPFLWIIAAGRPDGVLAALKLTRGRGWPKGVYLFGDDVLRVGLVVASELPRARSTLLVRLMAGGPLLAQAIEDLAALPADAHERAVAEQILLNLQHALGKKASRTPEEQEFIVTMQNTWEKAREEGLREGRDEGRREGRDEGGRAHARATLRRVLSMRNLVPSRQDEAQIDGCDDLATLDRWIEQAMVAQSVAEALRMNPAPTWRRSR